MGRRMRNVPTWVKLTAYGLAALAVLGAEEHGNGSALALLLLCFVVYRRLLGIERAVSSRKE